MSDLAKWLAKIEAGHPTDIDMGLERVRDVANNLAIQFSHTNVITVAGTNGKGTTCRFIENVAQAAGLSTAVYSSPHILRFNERIRIRQQEASDASICSAFERIEQAKKDISLTYFEYATLAALLLFQQAEVDLVILEVGLGGRLDATNIIDADINVLTSIGLDHQDYLGNTLEDIAFEKAGIIKANKRTVIGFNEMFARAETFIDKQQNQVLRRDIDFFLQEQVEGEEQGVRFEGTFHHQAQVYSYAWQASHIPAQNVMTGLAALWFLSECANDVHRNALIECLSDKHTIASVIESTQLAGRAQIMRRAPWIVFDVAHNKASADYLVKKIRTFTYAQCRIVVGMLKDKNVEQTLASLAELHAHFYCVSLPTKRGEQATRLFNALADHQINSRRTFESVELGLKCAIEESSNTDMIVLVGSFVSVAAGTEYLQSLDEV